MKPVEVRSKVPVIKAIFRGESLLAAGSDAVKGFFMKAPKGENY